MNAIRINLVAEYEILRLQKRKFHKATSRNTIVQIKEVIIMSWKLTKDYKDPMWGVRPLKPLRPLQPLKPLKPLKPMRPLKPLAPLGYKYVWRDGK